LKIGSAEGSEKNEKWRSRIWLVEVSWRVSTLPQLIHSPRGIGEEVSQERVGGEMKNDGMI